MKLRKLGSRFASVAILTMMLALGVECKAQDQTPEQPREATTTQPPDQPRQKADGERHGLPVETYAVAPGTKFLVRLEDELGTKGAKENEKFKVSSVLFIVSMRLGRLEFLAAVRVHRSYQGSLTIH
jgi:hypothetical protein